jgi:MATE family multidrug resistance protein
MEVVEGNSKHRGRAEVMACLRLAAPIIAAQLAFTSMGTVDTILAGRLGAKPLAAVAVGSMIWFLMFILFMGVFMAVSPIVAHRVGAGRPADEIGAFLRGALELAVIFGLAWTLVLEALTVPLLQLLHLDLETEALAKGYLRVIALGGVPYCLFYVLRNGADGHGLTHASLVAGFTGFAVNGILGYVLMYGKLGAPALGPTGTAYATTLAGCAMVGIYVVYYARLAALRQLHLFRRGRPRLHGQGEILRLGAPIAATLTAETWLFIIGALLMARFGSTVVAANQIAINFASLCFIVPLSIGMATTVRVGQAAGAQLTYEVALRGRIGIALGVGFALVSASAMTFLPQWIAALYTNDAQVSALAGRFLLYAAIFQIFDGVQGTASGALRGIKETRVPMWITVGAYWLVGMPVGLWLAFATELGPIGIWCGFIAGLAAAALGLSLLFFGKAKYPIAPSPERA